MIASDTCAAFQAQFQAGRDYYEPGTHSVPPGHYSGQTRRAIYIINDCRYGNTTVLFWQVHQGYPRVCGEHQRYFCNVQYPLR